MPHPSLRKIHEQNGHSPNEQCYCPYNPCHFRVLPVAKHIESVARRIYRAKALPLHIEFDLQGKSNISTFVKYTVSTSNTVTHRMSEYPKSVGRGLAPAEKKQQNREIIRSPRKEQPHWLSDLEIVKIFSHIEIRLAIYYNIYWYDIVGAELITGVMPFTAFVKSSAKTPDRSQRLRNERAML